MRRGGEGGAFRQIESTNEWKSRTERVEWSGLSDQDGMGWDGLLVEGRWDRTLSLWLLFGTAGATFPEMDGAIGGRRRLRRSEREREGQSRG